MAAVGKPVSAQRAAQLAANSRAYRARTTAAKYGVAVPAQFALKRPAMYRPPRAAPGASPAKLLHLKKVAAYQARQGAAERASTKAAGLRADRVAVISKLPQSRNTEVNIFTSRPLGHAVAANSDAKTILGREAASKVRAVGKRLKADFKSGEYGGLTGKLDAEEMARFKNAMSRMGAASDQAVGIYHNYEGGVGDLGSIISQLHYPKSGSVDGALTRLEAMADNVEKADRLYGESSPTGRLDI